MSEREIYEQWRVPIEPWGQGPTFEFDTRKEFIVRFMQFKARAGATLPQTGFQMFELLREFDEVRNHMNIEFEKMFKEHMQTCVRPILLPKDFVLR